MPHPPRRWFQFRLSTWFVLIAILAWSMLEWPWWILGVSEVDPDGTVWAAEADRINPDLLYPALTLVAFVGWKGAWAIGRRVKPRKVEQR